MSGSPTPQAPKAPQAPQAPQNPQAPQPPRGPQGRPAARRPQGPQPARGPQDPQPPRGAQNPQAGQGPPKPAALPEPATAPEPPARRMPPPTRITPVRRLLSLAIAGFAGLLGVGLIFGAQAAGVGPARIPYAVVVFGTQALFVLAFTMAMRPPGIRMVASVGIAVALATDLVAVVPAQATVAPLAYIAGGGFLVAVVGQLLRPEGRLRVAESLVSSSVIVVGVIAYGSLIVLTRLPVGTPAITVGLTAAGLAVIVARVLDTVAPLPRLAPHLPRGAAGVVAGAMLGTMAAGYLGSYLRGFEPADAALLGLVTAVAAVLADLSTGYAEAGRRMVGEPPTMWVARHLQGPLAGFGVAAPLTYLISVIFFVPRYL